MWQRWFINLLFALACLYALLVLPVLAVVMVILFILFGTVEAVYRIANGYRYK